MADLSRPVRVGSRWRRRRLRAELQWAVNDMAARADRPGMNVWRVQPVIEICGFDHYPAWRQAREKSWRRDRTQFTTRTWPAQLTPPAFAGVFLPQTYGGHYRGAPAEIAMPVFSQAHPLKSAPDFEQPYEPLVLALTAGWMRIAAADHPDQHAGLLAPPLVDLISRRPGPRIPCELKIDWPLQVSPPHVRPARRR
jgi:hypothetical protein